MPIHILPETTANRIAAGEVVERAALVAVEDEGHGRATLNLPLA